MTWTTKLTRRLLLLTLIGSAGCTFDDNIVDPGEVSGCYGSGAQSVLSLEGGLLRDADGRPMARAELRQLPSGSFLLTSPEVRLDGSNHIRPQKAGTRRFIPVQRQRSFFAQPRIRLFFPDLDGIGFTILYRQEGATCRRRQPKPPVRQL